MATETRQFDFLVLGSGIAGLTYALQVAPRGRVAIITNAGGCGSTLKEYDELLEHDPKHAGKARRFKSLVKDVNEFLASLDLD